jgi:hypothetical protein
MGEQRPLVGVNRRLALRAVAAAVVVALIALIALLPRPGPEIGPGTLYGHLWCIGVKFDSGVAYPVDQWPAGMHVKSQPIDLPAVLVDDAGKVLFREGDRVYVSAILRHASGGDTACSSLDSLAVEQVSQLSAGSTPP